MVHTVPEQTNLISRKKWLWQACFHFPEFSFKMLHTMHCFSRDSDTGTEHRNKHTSILLFKNLFLKHLLLAGCGLTDDACAIPSCHLPVYSRQIPCFWRLLELASLLPPIAISNSNAIFITKRTENQGFSHSGHSESRGGLTPEYHPSRGIERLWAPESHRATWRSCCCPDILCSTLQGSKTIQLFCIQWESMK